MVRNATIFGTISAYSILNKFYKTGLTLQNFIRKFLTTNVIKTNFQSKVCGTAIFIQYLPMVSFTTVRIKNQKLHINFFNVYIKFCM